jgi:Flp pilus assembly protein TadG
MLTRWNAFARVFSRIGGLRDEAGQSMVELALLLPLLVFGLIGGADLARAYALQLAVQNGARAGAEAYAIDQAKNQAQAIQRARDEMSRTPGMNAASATVTVSIKDTNGDDCTVSPPTVADPCFVTVRVRYTFQTIVPWPLVPNTANFDRNTSMRLFY